MTVRRRQAYGELERGVDPLERQDECDRNGENRPLDGSDPQPRREQHRPDSKDDLDPRIALGAQDVGNALERVTKRPQQHPRSLRPREAMVIGGPPTPTTRCWGTPRSFPAATTRARTSRRGDLWWGGAP